MSTVPSTEPIPSSSQTPSKGKKPRKKKPAGKGKPDVDAIVVNGLKGKADDLPNHDEEAEPDTPIDTTKRRMVDSDSASQREHVKVNGTGPSVNDLPIDKMSLLEEGTSRPQTNLSTGNGQATTNGDDTAARLEALAKERNALMEEVSQLRKSLEGIQEKHEEEIGTVRDQLEEVQGEKDQAESQYRTLLGKVNTIKSQLGERLKADAEDLAQARSHIEELEDQNTALKTQQDVNSGEIAKLSAEEAENSKELSTLRNRMNLSQQNWAKEREDLVQREAFARDEFESAKQAMQDWEILAMEERSIRENLAEKTAELEEQVATHREAHQKLESERDSQSLTVDGLQRALQELQEARKQERRELVENSQAQVEDLQKQLEEAQGTATDSTKALDQAQKEIERLLPFEMEVKEKNLLIGKLRHEAVILNDHLTKALKQLKKVKPEDTIDRQLVTNHFIHFLTLDRSDPKKFQILQIIASLLNWTDDQRESAGLARPGVSNPSLRTPISPWHRTPSTPSLSTEFLASENRGRGESLGGLWSEFLESEAQGGRSSRSTSISSSRRQ